ncbi:MAG TPA: amino acid adenylation domain-containing protein, partial [Gammaproteobacteria bacterium]|nr:amino acid adenylation domain-containing protein [Gammaproteobacteria bacterium]
VPAAYVALDSLPLTPNGKLDRQALPAPEDTAYAHRAFEPPEGEIEQTLARLWSELLGVEQIGRRDHFFELGGHSLLAVRLLSRLQAELAVSVPLAALFAHPALAELAAAIGQRERQALAPIVPVSRDEPLALSFAQERLWFLAQLEGANSVYNICTARRLRGRLDVAAWRGSLDALFARHEALRSVFVARDGRPEVRLLAADAGLPLVVHDLRNAPDAPEQLAVLQAEEAATPFDLAHGPLIRARLVRLGEEDYVFLLTMHHTVSDGWSMSVLTRELNALYAAFREGREAALPPLTIQYPDYAAWQRRWLAGERLETQANYWRETLAEVPTLLELPTDRPRPPQQDFSGAVLPIRLDAELTAGLKHLAQKHGATLFTTLLAAWAAVLARLSGQQDLIIGSPTANRGRREIEDLIGFFVNTLALRIDLSGEPSVAELIARAQRTAVAAQDHQDLPFEQVVEIVKPPRSLDRSPLFQVLFTLVLWQNNERPAADLPELEVAPHATALRQVKFDLELTLAEWNGTIAGGLSYATALFDAATIERHRGYLVALLRAMVADDRQPVMRIELLAPEERTLLLTEWNRTETPYPAQLCVHELFEAQVARAPEAIALVHEEQTLSYGELNARANRLARHLVALGVRPDDRVGLCVERSLEMVVGLLAVLKAGGAYVPLDPAYPAERLAFMLEDCAPDVVLTHAAASEALETATANLDRAPATLDLVADAERWAHESATDLDPQALGLTSRHLAYIIYTSGSTGAPKGVMVEHLSLANFLHAISGTLSVSAQDRLLAVTSISFDIAGLELYLPLVNGANVVISDSADPFALRRTLSAHHISIMQATPATWRALLDAQWKPAPDLTILCGGEAMPFGLAPRLLDNADCLLNLYGPTETTIWSSCDNVSLRNNAHPAQTIGRPIANTRIYLLDGYRQPVPLGAAGEIHIGGAGVARGYLNRPELTAERFIDSPFVKGDRLY